MQLSNMIPSQLSTTRCVQYFGIFLNLLVAIIEILGLSFFIEIKIILGLKGSLNIVYEEEQQCLLIITCIVTFQLTVKHLWKKRFKRLSRKVYQRSVLPNTSMRIIQTLPLFLN